MTNTPTAEASSIGFDILTLKAQLRGAFSLLSTMDEYGENADLCDVGFALIDAEKRLDEINARVEAFGFSVARQHN